MKFIRETSPYIRKKVSVKRMMLDVIIALMPVTLFAIVQSSIDGKAWECLSIFLVSIISMLFFEFLVVLITKWPTGMKFKELFTKEGFKKVRAGYTVNNITAPIISALIYALIMPIGCDLYVVFIGAFVGIFVGKMVFGGLGSNIFNPAAVGRIFVCVCFASKVNNAYSFDAIAGGTPLALITTSAAEGFRNISNLTFALSQYSLADLFLGNIPGAMGEVSALMIIIGAVYLFIRRSADIRVTLSMLLSFAIIMLTVGLVAQAKLDVDFNAFEFLSFELLSGGLLFGAVFMATDPVTSPTSGFGRVIFGSLIGCLVAYIRLFGAYPEGVAFAILIANMFAPLIDYLLRGSVQLNWKKALGYTVSLTIIVLIASFSVAGGI